MNDDEYARPLDAKELEAAREVWRLLSDCYGKINARTNRQLQRDLAEYKEGYFKMTDGRIRKIIRFLRTEGHIPDLVASASGYYRTRNKDELKRYILGLRQKARAENELANTMERVNGIEV